MSEFVQQLYARLDHLSAFSHEIILLSGDDAAAQHQGVEGYLSQQGEGTNICYIKAQPCIDRFELRHQIMGQLFSREADQDVPLSQLVNQATEQEERQLLVAITRAHNLSDALLDELCQWAAINLEAPTPWQLTIILAGQTAWTRDKKARLSVEGAQQAVVINLRQQLQPDGSQLDALIAERRAAFAKRMAERHGSQSGLPLLRRLWFRTLMLLVFVVIFASIVYSQLWPHYASVPLQTPTPVVSEQPPGPATEVDANHVSKVQGTELVPLTESEAQSVLPSARESEDSPLLQGAADESPALAATPISQVPTATSPEGRVMSWQQARARIPVADTSADVTSASELALVNEKLLALTGGAMIQLAGMGDTRRVQGFIRQHRLTESSWVYGTIRQGEPWYVVLAKKHFASVDEARDALPRMREETGIDGAFVKSLVNIHAELQRP